MISISISSGVSVSLTTKRFTETLDEIDIDIIQCFVDRLTETPNEIDRDIIWCSIDRLTETLSSVSVSLSTEH
jgi:hypothetical protein